MRKLDDYWMSNHDWWHWEDEKPVLNDDDPEEAKKSYEHYQQQLEHLPKYG